MSRFKDLAQARAEELADSTWGEDYYNLPEATQLDLLRTAEHEVAEEMGDQAEQAYDYRHGA